MNDKIIHKASETEYKWRGDEIERLGHVIDTLLKMLGALGMAPTILDKIVLEAYEKPINGN